MVGSNLGCNDDLWELLALDGMHSPIALFNGPICTTTGLYRITEISQEEARSLVARYGFVSAVGHRATAEVFSSVLQVEVPMNRIQYEQQVGQKAIALKLNIRPPEGELLSVDEMLNVGFELQLLQRLE